MEGIVVLLSVGGLVMAGACLVCFELEMKAIRRDLMQTGELLARIVSDEYRNDMASRALRLHAQSRESRQKNIP